jgi:alkylhydroperoxidase family enzyme
VGRAVGISEEQLLELPRYESSPAFDPVERLVLDLAVAMARTPCDVPEELRARLRERFDEAQLVELAAAIAWEHHRARFNRVFDVQPAGFSEGAFCVLPERAGREALPRSGRESG